MQKRQRTRAGDDPAENGFTERVHAVVRAVPRGQVVSYGGVAAILGQPRAARAVGRALCALSDGSDVPWWRVINRNAEISIKCADHGPALQRALLEGEGVRFDRNGRTDWKRFGWGGGGVPHGIREDEWLDTDAQTETRAKKGSRAARSRSRNEKPAVDSRKRSASNAAAKESPTAPGRRTRSKRAAGTRR